MNDQEMTAAVSQQLKRKVDRIELKATHKLTITPNFLRWMTGFKCKRFKVHSVQTENVKIDFNDGNKFVYTINVVYKDIHRKYNREKIPLPILKYRRRMGFSIIQYETKNEV